MFVVEAVEETDFSEIDANTRAHGLADFRIIDFRAGQRADGIQ